jgi:enamine deaminase RidA (YjgF/YER057c/UK114 family)
MQSGTTAIDTDGNVIGVGDVAKQVDAIVDIAAQSTSAAGGDLADVVRSRIYGPGVVQRQPVRVTRVPNQ